MTDQEYLEKNEDKRVKPLIYSRTMGYYRPIESMNVGKQGEHKQRTLFLEKSADKKIQVSA